MLLGTKVTYAPVYTARIMSLRNLAKQPNLQQVIISSVVRASDRFLQD